MYCFWFHHTPAPPTPLAIHVWLYIYIYFPMKISSFPMNHNLVIMDLWFLELNHVHCMGLWNNKMLVKKRWCTSTSFTCHFFAEIEIFQWQGCLKTTSYQYICIWKNLVCTVRKLPFTKVTILFIIHIELQSQSESSNEPFVFFCFFFKGYQLKFRVWTVLESS